MADGGLVAATAPPQGLEARRKEFRIPDARVMLALCGPCDRTLSRIETDLRVSLLRQGDRIVLILREDSLDGAEAAFEDLLAKAASGDPIEESDIPASLAVPGASPVFLSRRKPVLPRTATQKSYAESLVSRTLNFGIGPAGTGKTWMAVAAGVNFLLKGEVERLILSRPAVEAGERLGFLPGDMKEKIDPYMQPLYDALADLLPGKQVSKMMEDKVIEIAPLAFMRGRTLSNAFVLLDEAQNATPVQMKMFLTRLGQGSRMALTGDVSQVDLPKGVPSGLAEAERILAGVEGIGFTRFTHDDVVRHPLVAWILKAWDAA
jgi:phosphate starvation-inducible protein PhoH and related proteins